MIEYSKNNMTNVLTNESNKQQASLTEEEKRILENAERLLKDVPQSKYIKFEDGERKQLWFLVDKLKIVYSKFNKETNEYSETENTSNAENEGYKRMFKFIVVDPNRPDHEQEWSVSNYETIKRIIGHLKDGHKFLSIKRIGTGKKTIYDIEAIGNM